LSELCTSLGYCAAGRHPERFPTPWPGTIESLADEVLTLEGFDPQIHNSERKELRQWLLSRLGGQLSDPPRAT
jgi:hypothetical protein